MVRATHAHLLEESYNGVVRSARAMEASIGDVITAAGANIGSTVTTWDGRFQTPGVTPAETTSHRSSSMAACHFRRSAALPASTPATAGAGFPPPQWINMPPSPHAGSASATPTFAAARTCAHRVRRAQLPPARPHHAGRPPHPPRPRLHSAGATAEEDLAALQSLVAFYRRANGGANPIGPDNEDFTAELRGKNAHRLAVLPPDLASIDAQGRLLDRWGTPYFFHAVSRTELEIRSAGPDGKLGTDDDVQLPEARP